MLTHFEVSNFKLFKKPFILKSIPQILLIGGENNSGKTSILEALLLPFDQLDSGMFVKHLQWRGLTNIEVESLFELIYHNLESNQPIKFKYTLNGKKQEVTYTFHQDDSPPITETDDDIIDIGREILSLSSETQKLYDRIVISCLSKNKEVFQLHLMDTQEGIYLDFGKNTKKAVESIAQFNQDFYVSFISATQPTSSRGNAERFDQLARARKTEKLLEALQIMEPKLRSLSTIEMGEEPVIYGDMERLKIPLSLMGEGINRLMSILLSISCSGNGITLIDELENGFHYSLLPKIMKVIAEHAQSNRAQVIATTYSRELLQATVENLPQDLQDKFRYMRIDRDGDEFKIRNYDFKVLATSLEANFETR